MPKSIYDMFSFFCTCNYSDLSVTKILLIENRIKSEPIIGTNRIYSKA